MAVAINITALPMISTPITAAAASPNLLINPSIVALRLKTDTMSSGLDVLQLCRSV